MTWQPPEQDDDEERMRITLAPVMAARIRYLLALTVMAGKDRTLAEQLGRRDPKTLTPEHRHWVQQLLWRYRRALPAGVAPRLNPDDPIVREMEAAGG